MKNKELEMNLLIGPGFKLGFVLIFHFPVPRFSNIPIRPRLKAKFFAITLSVRWYSIQP